MGPALSAAIETWCHGLARWGLTVGLLFSVAFFFIPADAAILGFSLVLWLAPPTAAAFWQYATWIDESPAATAT